MIGLIQRVKQANVVVAEDIVGAIEHGILLLLGVHQRDTVSQAEKLVSRILSYRIFDDETGKMNLSLTDVRGGLLIVPQFTLVADTKSGRRPGFSTGASPTHGEYIYQHAVSYASSNHPIVAQGRFGAHMSVNLCNDGPVTFSLEA